MQWIRNGFSCLWVTKRQRLELKKASVVAYTEDVKGTMLCLTEEVTTVFPNLRTEFTSMGCVLLCCQDRIPNTTQPTYLPSSRNN